MCGTHGCAIGECPIVFPKDWVFGELGTPVLKNSTFVKDSSMEFFDLNSEEDSALFHGNSLHDITGKQVFKFLSSKTKRKTVANRLRKFVKLKKNGII